MKVLVSGSSSGIGRATALKFLSSGHEVIGMDILPSSISHPFYTHFIHDVADRDYPELKGIEGFVHSAGIFLGEEEVIETNLLGTIRLCEHLLSLGDIRSVCLIGSASARNGSEFPYYVASKGGLLSYGKNLALRLAKIG
ncbi:MAG: SDR family oxidoreductase, partial [Bacilli bacterium]|nr:SDR family oxidoreductase [Bacilli bacterium]